MKKKLLLTFSLFLCVLGMWGQAVTDVGTFEALQSALSSDGSYIRLTADITVTSRLTVPNGTIIDGGGHTLCVPVPYLNEDGSLADSPSSFGVFYIASSSIVTLRNMKLLGGSGYAAVTNYGSLTMENVTMTLSNRGLNNSGKAVMNNCNLVRCAADYGGGVLNSGQIVMNGCSYTENRDRINSGTWGGGGAAENQGTMYLNNTTMSNNLSDECGAAINNYGGTLYIMNSTISGNTAIGSYNYGALRDNGGPVYAVNSIIADNKHITNTGTGTVTESDIKYSGTYINCVLGTSNAGSQTNCKVATTDGEGIFAEYYNAGMYSNDDSYTTGFSRTVLVKDGDSYSAPVSSTGLAKDGATQSYFNSYIDASGNLVITMCYKNGTEIVSLIPGGSTDVTTLTPNKNDNDPIGAGIVVSSSTHYYTVTRGNVVNGTMTGVSLYGDSYVAGTNVTVSATAADGYTFTGWKLNGESSVSSTSNPYTFSVTNNVTIEPEFTLTSTLPSVSEWDDLKSKMAAGGYIVLSADITDPTPSSTSFLEVPTGKTVTLDLNGHKIDHALTAATKNGYVIYNSGTLTINGTGSITGGWNSGHCGGIHNTGTLTINGGDITGNKAGTGYEGGGIMNSGTLTINGGSITNNSAVLGGGVSSSGMMYVNGGSITGNTATSIAAGISQNPAAGELHLNGAPYISGNLKDGTTENNINVYNDLLIHIDGPLTNTTPIGINSSDAVVFTTGLSGNGTAANFTSDNAAYIVKLTNAGEAELAVGGYCGSTSTENPEGKGLVWALSGTGSNKTLTISVNPDYANDDNYSKEMKSYHPSSSYYSTAPWKDELSNIKSLVVESGVRSIGYGAFFECTVATSATIPNTVTHICGDAFKRCSALTSVTIPSSVTQIDTEAFYNCPSLATIIFDGCQFTDVGLRVFLYCPSTAAVTVNTCNPFANVTETAIFSSITNGTLTTGASVTIDDITRSEGKYVWKSGQFSTLNGLSLYQVTLNANYEYLTYYSDVDLELPSGYEVMTITDASLADRSVVVTPLSQSYIPKDTPVILHKTSTATGGTYNLLAYTGTVNTVTPYNGFTGVTAATDVTALEGDVQYILVGDEFVRLDQSEGGTIGANRCYLYFNTATAPSRLKITGGTTGIDSVIDDGNEAWYDLKGQKLSGRPVKKGLYIMNGKKVVIK